MKRRPEQTVSKVSRGALFLDVDLIQPGDVVLERGTGTDSAWIARATGGPFSHAALVVDRGFLFESDDEGVGYTPLTLERVERRATGRRRLSRLPHVREAVVLRFPRLTDKRARDLGDDLVEALGPLDGKEYPAWSALAAATPGGWLGKQLGRVVLSIADWYENTQVVVPGPFCSEVVAGVFADVMPRRRLFDKPRDPTRVNPNSFLESRLRPVAGAVCTADLGAILDKVHAKEYNDALLYKSRKQATGMMVGFRVAAKKADLSLGRIKKVLQSFRKRRRVRRS